MCMDKHFLCIFSETESNFEDESNVSNTVAYESGIASFLLSPGMVLCPMLSDLPVFDA